LIMNSENEIGIPKPNATTCFILMSLAFKRFKTCQ
jgi:hypothetical protein